MKLIQFCKYKVIAQNMYEIVVDDERHQYEDKFMFTEKICACLKENNHAHA